MGKIQELYILLDLFNLKIFVVVSIVRVESHSILFMEFQCEAVKYRSVEVSPV